MNERPQVKLAATFFWGRFSPTLPKARARGACIPSCRRAALWYVTLPARTPARTPGGDRLQYAVCERVKAKDFFVRHDRERVRGRVSINDDRYSLLRRRLVEGGGTSGDRIICRGSAYIGEKLWPITFTSTSI